ncbi:hypothetical protein NBRC111894_2862 [Sporolactobacillus inulinus]|uniref:Uncharacterized protein n=1 Tax=Sporolactobacillus inulinus TaxID=2078 RepID=A0A4Y1ZFQ0_9BACL|nr:hypothetical protein NBRC111894_2862 [Sporolactobacillus inulinus]
MFERIKNNFIHLTSVSLSILVLIKNKWKISGYMQNGVRFEGNKGRFSVYAKQNPSFSRFSSG